MTLKNFEVNTKYNKVYSSDFHSFTFVEPAFRELLEYHTVGEFNRIRGKEFLSFSAFHQVYTEANTKLPFVPNYTQLLTTRLSAEGKTSIIIVSGIPGSGKTKFSESLTKLLASEGLAAV